MSNGTSVTNLTTDAMPQPPRISKENLHVENTQVPLEEKNQQRTSTEDNTQNDNDTSKGQNIPHHKPKFKSRTRGGDNVINYNIINSNGVKIGSTTHYTLNLNQMSPNVTQNLMNENKPVKAMPPNVRRLCECEEEITTEDMLLIKTHLGSGWKDVARKIGFSDGQIYQFVQKYNDSNGSGIDEVIYQILLDWKQANTSDARIGELSSIIWSCREYDCIERLAESRKIL